jgi:hypothetical protein
MSPVNFEMVDVHMTVNITSAPVGMCDDVMTDLVKVLNSFNTISPISSVNSTSGVSTFTLKDARTVTYTLNLGGSPPESITFQVVSPSFWNATEFNQIQALAQVLVTLQLEYEMTDLTVTYN